MTEQVTDTLMKNIMPQLDQQIKKHIEEGNSKQDFSRQLEDKIDETQAKFDKQIKELSLKTEKDLQAGLKQAADDLAKQVDNLTRQSNKSAQELDFQIQQSQTDIDEKISQLKKQMKKDYDMKLQEQEDKTELNR